MKKILTLIVAAMATMTMSAQTAGFKTFKLEGALSKQSTMIANKTVNKAPRKALAENQLWMGNYTSNTVASEEEGLGFTSYAGEITIAAPVEASTISGFDGGSMVGMRVGLANATNIAEMFIYGVTETSMELLADVTPNTGVAGWNEVTFDTPVTLDLTKYPELLVGFVYTQTSSNYPISLINEGTIEETYIYGDYGSGEGWYSFGGSSYGNLSVQVLVEKDFAKNSVKAVSCKDVYAQLGEGGNLNFVFNNQGTKAVENFSYTVTSDGTTSEEQTVSLTSAPEFGENFTLTVPVEAQAACGTKEYTVTVTKVNGEENASTDNTVTGKFITVQKLFKHRVAVEEFTGTGCGYCPRGWVGMNLLREKFGDDFVGVAIHQYNSSDPMYIAKSNYASLSFSGAPSCMIERGDETDPYYGSGDALGIYDDFSAAQSEIATAGVEVSGVWNEDKTKVDAKASVESLVDNANFDIEYVLIADGLKTSTWSQSNYYYQYTAANADATGTPLEDFCKGGTYGKSSVKGLTFNDVAIASSYVSSKNTAASLTIPTAYTPVESSCTMSMPTKSALVSAIKNADYDVWVAALIIDPATGKIVNAVKAKVQEPTPEYTLDFYVENADETCDEWAVQVGDEKLEYPYDNDEPYTFVEGSTVYVGGICTEALHTMVVTVNGEEVDNTEGEYGAFLYSFELTQNTVIKVTFKGPAPAVEAEYAKTDDTKEPAVAVTFNEQKTCFVDPYKSNETNVTLVDANGTSYDIVRTTDNYCLKDYSCTCTSFILGAELPAGDYTLTIPAGTMVVDDPVDMYVFNKEDYVLNFSYDGSSAAKLVNKNNVDAINNVDVQSASVKKALRNGNLVIVKGNNEYNAAGALLK